MVKAFLIKEKRWYILNYYMQISNNMCVHISFSIISRKILTLRKNSELENFVKTFFSPGIRKKLLRKKIFKFLEKFCSRHCIVNTLVFPWNKKIQI